MPWYIYLKGSALDKRIQRRRIFELCRYESTSSDLTQRSWQWNYGNHNIYSIMRCISFLICSGVWRAVGFNCCAAKALPETTLKCVHGVVALVVTVVMVRWECHVMQDTPYVHDSVILAA